MEPTYILNCLLSQHIELWAFCRTVYTPNYKTQQFKNILYKCNNKQIKIQIDAKLQYTVKVSLYINCNIPSLSYYGSNPFLVDFPDHMGNTSSPAYNNLNTFVQHFKLRRSIQCPFIQPLYPLQALCWLCSHKMLLSLTKYLLI